MNEGRPIGPIGRIGPIRPILDTLLKDLRYAARGLRKNPVFTFVAVITLALGIGANTAIFSLVNAVLLKPLPLPEADRLVTIWEDLSVRGFPRSDVAIGTYNDWRSQQSVFTDVAAVEWRALNLTGEGDPERVSGYSVTSNFFGVIGIQPALGRTFSADEDKPQGPKVVILSFNLWQRRFGGQHEILN